VSQSHNEEYSRNVRELVTSAPSHNDLDFTTYQFFIISFLVIVGSITLGTSVYFIKRHFFEDEESDEKLMRYKFMRNQDEFENTKACYHYSKN
jgi:hypothetical protein